MTSLAMSSPLPSPSASAADTTSDAGAAADREAAGATGDRSGFTPRLTQLRTAKEFLFLATRFPVGLFWFITIVTLLSTGAGLLIVMIGFVVLAFLLLLTRMGAVIERQFVGFVDGRPIESPYREPVTPTAWGRIKTWVTDPATYRDLLYLLLQFPIGIISLVTVVTLVSVVGGMIAAPILYWAVPGGIEAFVINGEPRWVIDTWWEAVPVAIAGVAALFPAAYVIAGLATVCVWLGRGLLGPTAGRRIAAADQRTDRSVAANLVERKRIERDLHDGAQQQLVAVAMNLGRAQSKFEADPDEAMALVDSAQQQTKAAIVELRNLARGILPAVLTDRGLDAALSALAQQSNMPVSVRVEIDERPPEPVESAAYFVVAEALTNSAKHSGAAEVRIEARQRNNVLVIEVSDDGRGGANPSGSGLLGLADRVASVGGRLTVTDGLAGGTVVRAELPCGS